MCYLQLPSALWTNFLGPQVGGVTTSLLPVFVDARGRAGRSVNPGDGRIMHIFARSSARDRAGLCRHTHTHTAYM